MSWLDCGLEVDRIIGHSFGQLTGLCVAGSLSLSDALRLVAERARLIHTLCSSETSAMLAVEGTNVDMDFLLHEAEQQCRPLSADIACYNGPKSFVIAGDLPSIEAIERASEALSTPLRMKRLENSHAFHSRLLDCIMPGLLRTAEKMQFATPRIPIEACSNEDDWSDITAEKIARHTRMPVHFMDAVRRLEQQVDGPLIWLEAGSGSPIMTMLKRAVQPRSPGHHVYIPTSLRGPDAQASLAKAVCRLWSNSLRVQFWLFHKSQRSSYSWINLPPYQFAKTRHWLDYKPTSAVWEVAERTSVDSPAELVRMLPSQSREGEALFEINTKHELYQLHTSGHEVVDQTLCPASLYIEFVLMASRLLTDTGITLVPQVKDLAMSSPLVLNPTKSVLLRLVGVRAPSRSWDFTIFSHDEHNDGDSVTHGSGNVSLSESGTPPTISNFQSLSSLMLQRCKDIESFSTSIGFKGPTVYQAMRPLVTYADYFHGIQSFYTSGNEAAARIAMPLARPENMGTSFCDPVLTDSVAQVAGVLANCFCVDEEGEMWICNFMGDIQYTQEFLETGRNKQSWTAYSKYVRPAPKKLQCDIFVFDHDSGRLVLTMMACSFQKASVKSLKKVLGKLNSQKPAALSAAVKASSERSEADLTVDNNTPATAVSQLTFQAKKVPNGMPETGPTVQQHSQLKKPNGVAVMSEGGPKSLQKIREMLSDVLEIPLGEISPNSVLADLGVDSLLATELFTEMRARLNATVSHSQFATISDVQGLALLVSGSPPHASDLTHTSVNASSTPAVEMETVIYGNGDGVSLSADIYYPDGTDEQRGKPRPIGKSLLLLN